MNKRTLWKIAAASAVVIGGIGFLLYRNDDLRPIGFVPVDERGDVRMYVKDSIYLLYENGDRLARIEVSDEESLSIAKVTDDVIVLVRDNDAFDFHQGFVYTVDRGSETVDEVGDLGTYWGLTNGDEYVMFADEYDGVTRIRLVSFTGAAEVGFFLDGPHIVEQIDSSPDGKRFVVAARYVDQPMEGGVAGGIWGANVATGSIAQYASNFISGAEPSDLAMSSLILRWQDDVNAVFRSGPDTEGVILVP